MYTIIFKFLSMVFLQKFMMIRYINLGIFVCVFLCQFTKLIAKRKPLKNNKVYWID